MAEDTIVTKWDLDASGYLQTLQQLNAGLASVASSTGNMKTAVDAVASKMGAANAHLGNMSRATVALEKNNKGLIRTWSDVSSGIRDVSSVLAALYRGIDAALTRGDNFSDMMQALPFSINEARDATKGLVGTTALMEAANRSSSMQIGLTSEQFAKLAEQSTILAQRLGRDTDGAFTQLIESIGKGNVRGLESIGIVVDQERAFSDYAKALGKTVEDLSELERQQATLQITMEGLSKQIGDQIIDVQNAGDSWTAFKNAASDAINTVARKIAESKIGSGIIGAATGVALTIAGDNAVENAIRQMEEKQRKKLRAFEDEQFAQAIAKAQQIQDARDAGPEAPSRSELARQAHEQAIARAEAHKKAQQEQEAQLKDSFDRLIYNAQNKIGSLFLTSLQRSFVDQIAKLPADMQAKALQFLEAESPKVAANIRKAIETINAAAQDEERKEAARNLFAYQANIEHGLEEARKKRDDFLNEMAFAIADISNQSYIGSALGQQYKDKNGDVSRSKLGAMGYGEDQDSGRRVVDTLQMQSDELNRIVQQNEGLDYFTRMFPPDAALAIIENIHEMDASMQHMAAGPMAAFGQAAEVGFSSFADGLQQALSGQKSFADALKQGLGAFLTTFSKRMTLLGLEESALALASFATGDYPGGGIHIAAAGAFFAAAAATGIAGASLSAGASQRQSRAAWRPGTERGTGGASSATGARAQNSVSVTYNINSILPPDQQQVDAWFKGALRRANAGA